MRAIRPIHRSIRPALFLLVASAACASAPMGRGASEGDEIGGDDDSAGAADDDGSLTAESSGDAPTSGSGGDATDSPTMTGPGSESDPGETATATDTGAEDSAESSSTDPTDATESSGEDGGMDESTSAADDTEAPADIDLSGYSVIQTASAREFVFPDGVIVPAGTVIVIGRGASRASFENFWGTAWDDDVVYFEGAGSFPTMNGDETYTLLAPNATVVDGPTPALAVNTAMARIDAGIAAGNIAAWETALSPNFDSTPGISDATGGTTGQPYISEYSDPIGNNNYDFEFVEIHVPG